MTNILYVVCVEDKNNDIVRFAYGGGSSSAAYIRAFEDESSAIRSKASLRKHSLKDGETFAIRPFKEVLT